MVDARAAKWFAYSVLVFQVGCIVWLLMSRAPELCGSAWIALAV